MDQVRVVIAHELRSYREVIAGTLGLVRPGAQVTSVEPDDLSDEIARLDPQLVLCSRIADVTDGASRTWIVLHPDGQSHAVISARGKQSVVSEIDFDHVLAIFDEVAGAASPESAALPQ